MKSYQEDTLVQQRKWWILIAVAMFTFMSTLDGSIVNIALPTISANMSVPMNQAEWVVSVYLMVICACLLLFGKIGDSWGKIKVFIVRVQPFVGFFALCTSRPSDRCKYDDGNKYWNHYGSISY